jgi:hypothetical protein
LLISSIPVPTSSGQMAIAVPASTLSALAKTGNGSLERVVRAYDAAAQAGSAAAMTRALDRGVRVCHRLGLRTATSALRS